MPNSRRTCIFCGAPADSREHAWPAWVLEWVGSGQPSTIVLQLGQAPEKVFSNSELTVKYVCKGCNNTWMSDLETRAMLILKPLIIDFTIPLDRAQQSIVSAWCVKTAMVFECTNPNKGWFYTPQERGTLASSSTIPHNTSIWMGRSGQSGGLFVQNRRMSNPVLGRGHILSEGFVSTFGLGRFVLQVLTVRLREQYERVRVQLPASPGPWAASLAQIWPIRNPTSVWPPQASFNAQGTTLDDLVSCP